MHPWNSLHYSVINIIKSSQALRPKNKLRLSRKYSMSGNKLETYKRQLILQRLVSMIQSSRVITLQRESTTWRVKTPCYSSNSTRMSLVHSKRSKIRLTVKLKLLVHIHQRSKYHSSQRWSHTMDHQLSMLREM